MKYDWKKELELTDEELNEYIYSSNGEPLANDKGVISLARKKIVRCRDCKYYEPNTYSHFTCNLHTYHAEPNAFCAWGEKRGDA